MRILVTRPQDDASDTAARLVALGHEAIVAPLISVEFTPGPAIDAHGVQAFLATSANGVRALARRVPIRDVPLFAVGRETARTARALRFSAVTDADGDGNALAKLVSSSLAPETGALLHATSREAPGGLAKTLEQHGFRVRSEIMYATPAVPELPQVAAVALRERRLGGVLFFSARTAGVFETCVERAGLSATCASLGAYCISAACADALGALVFAKTWIAARPNQDALLALLS